MDIGKTIKHYRLQAKWTQHELANGICSVSHLSKIENGTKDANQETINLLLERLNVNLEIESNKFSTLTNKLDILEKKILFCDLIQAKAAYKLVNKDKDKYISSHLNHRYALLSLRYHLFVNDKEKSTKLFKEILLEETKMTMEEQFVWNYYQGLYFLLVEGNRIEALNLFKNLTSVETLKDTDLLYYLALTSAQQNNNAYAVLYATEALVIFSKQFNIKRLFHVHMLLGICLTRLRAFDEALKNFEKVKYNAEVLKDEDLLAEVNHNIGYLMKKNQKYNEALEYYKEVLKHQETHSDKRLITLGEIAEIYIKIGQYDVARSYVSSVLEYSRKKNYKENVVKFTIYNYVINNQLDQLIDYLEIEGLDFFKEAKMWEDLNANLRIISDYYFKKDNMDKFKFYSKKLYNLMDMMLVEN